MTRLGCCPRFVELFVEKDLQTVLSVRVRQWLMKLQAAASRRTRRRSAAFQPHLDVLEDRWLLSTFTVTTTHDGGAGSLRQAICEAEAGDTIDFAGNLAGQSLTLTQGPLVIDKDLTITGLGADELTIRGNGCNPSRVFTISHCATVSLSGLTIADGQANQGGGIFNAGTLTVTSLYLLRQRGGGSRQ